MRASTAHVDFDSTAAATGIGLWHERVACGHAFGAHELDAAEELLVLDLLVAQAHECLQRRLVAERMLAADLEDLRADEALAQAEHVGVGARLDLAHEARLAFAEEAQARNQR
jgi:hypothetical protein